MLKVATAVMVGFVAAAPALVQDAASFAGSRAEAVVGWSEPRVNLSDISTASARERPYDIGFGGRSLL